MTQTQQLIKTTLTLGLTMEDMEFLSNNMSE